MSCFTRKVLSPHTEPVAGRLHEEPVGAVPVSVDDIRPAVAVEVGERHSSAVLGSVRHTWRGEQLVNHGWVAVDSLVVTVCWVQSPQNVHSLPVAQPLPPHQ